MRKQHYFVFFFIFSVLTSFVSAKNHNSKISTNHSKNYNIQDPIAITSDNEFMNYCSSGNGSKTDPYILKDFIIDANGGVGIKISNTSACFLITNCIITNGIYGIYIYSIQSGTATLINNSCCFHAIDGIYAEQSPKTTISKNNCSYNKERAIRIIECSDSIIDNNLGNFCGRTAINVQYSYNVSITNNHCKGNQRAGIFLRVSPQCRIIHNIIEDNYLNGIFPRDSFGCKITDNVLINCGIYVCEDTLNELFSYTFERNTINSKDFGWYENLTDKVLDNINVGQMVLVNCSNIKIKNEVINFSSTGLTLFFCSKVDIYNCVFNHHTKVGLEILYSSYINVHKSTVNFCHARGVRLYFADNVVLFENIISFNQEEGLTIYYSNSNLIFNNFFESNTNYGCLITDLSTNNRIYSNSFVNNSIFSFSQGLDNVYGNLWYNTSTSTGNFWSNYFDSGYYNIEGSGEARDLYPNICELIYDDNFEENDDFVSAPELFSNNTYYLRSFDIDYFKILLDIEKSYTFSLSYDYDNLELVLYIYNETKHLLNSTRDSPLKNMIQEYIPPQSGYYYLVIEVLNGHKGLPYEIEIISRLNTLHTDKTSLTLNSSSLLLILFITIICKYIKRKKIPFRE